MDKILFIIYQDEVKFVPKSMSCKDFYLSLGGKIEEYDKIIRGMIEKDKIIFMKSNFKYDEEVVSLARRCAPVIKQQLNMPHLLTCCGIDRGNNNEEWKPSLIIQDNQVISDEQKELLSRVSTSSENEVFEFKNNVEDDNFSKYACKFTLYLILATIIVKAILIFRKTISMDNRWISLIVFLQVIFLIISYFGYKFKWKKTIYFGLGASACLFALLDFPDIVIGTINLLFTIDQKYIVKIIEFIDKIIHKKNKV